MKISQVRERLQPIFALCPVSISQHATERLQSWQRTGEAYCNDDAGEVLTRAVREGRITNVRPGDAVEVVWRDLYLVVKYKHRQAYVLTVNGDAVFRNWFYKTHIRLRYSAKAKAAI